MKSWPKVKLGQVIFCSIFSLIYLYLPLFTYIYPYLSLIALIWPYLPLFGPKIPFLFIFSLTYLYLPLFTYIWLYLGFITLIWAYLPLIALILPYMPYSPYIYALFYWDCTSVQNFRVIGPLFMEISHLKLSDLNLTFKGHKSSKILR